jgi:Ferritin-like domain
MKIRVGHLEGKQAQWNVVGHNFRDLHLQLDEVVDASEEASDTIAERTRAFRATPDGRAPTIAATATMPEFPPTSTTRLLWSRRGCTWRRPQRRRRGPVHDRPAARDLRGIGEVCLDGQRGEQRCLRRGIWPFD